jgi:hypothetical protein
MALVPVGGRMSAVPSGGPSSTDQESPTVLRLLLLRLLPGRLLPILVAYEIYRLLRSLSEERRVARARPITPTDWTTLLPEGRPATRLPSVRLPAWPDRARSIRALRRA